MHPVEDVSRYPRPPRAEQVAQRARIWFAGELICDTTDVVRILETFHPPTIYLPRDAFVDGVLQPAREPLMTTCEWKGRASYLDIGRGDAAAARAGWTYVDPRPGFRVLADRIAVYPGRMERCELDGEQVVAQDGDFYGGWITSWITGPIKGAPGTTQW